MINILTYSSVCGLKFDATQPEAESEFGEPLSRGKNREGEEEFLYKNFILRFDASSGLFRECTLLPGCEATINGVEVVWDMGLLLWMAGQDADLKEDVGFIISYRLGIAVCGFHEEDDSGQSIHAFKKGDWDEFFDLAVPFVVPG